MSISSDTVFLVSGGGRGITAQCVVELARQFQCRFVLLGRTALQDEPDWAQGVTAEADLKKQAIAALQAAGDKPTPVAVGRMVSRVQAGREIRQTVAEVRAAGGDAVYLSADITSADALRAALAEAAHLGPITAILHGAGNLADKLIEQKTEADFEMVYAAKVEGLENMLAVIPPDRLAYLVLFSSVAGFYGNIGQADYAIANEILNKAAYYFSVRFPNCRVLALDWGPWDGGMVTPQLRAYFDQLNIRIIPVDVGTQMLAQELRRPASDPVQVVIGSAIQPQPEPPASDLQTYRLRRTLRLEDNPFLGDHVVNSQAVLPMVSAMSWMASACEQIYPGYRYFGFENYRVLKGIVFDDTLADSYVLELTDVEKSAERIVMEAMVRSASADGKPRFHYNARITLLPRLPEPRTFYPPSIPAPATAITGEMLYSDGTLFHGSSFQGIERVLGLDESGLNMRCVLPRVDRAYQGQFPIQAFNYFMTDISLQSIGTWARRIYDMGSLPLRAAGGENYRALTPGGAFYVTLLVISHSPTNVTADISVYDDDNRLYLTIHGLEVTMSTRLNEMFLKNRLPETPR